jgi:hypothetical protein
MTTTPRTPKDQEDRRQVRRLERMLWRAMVTPGTAYQLDLEQKAAAAGTPLTPRPRDFGLGAYLPIARGPWGGAPDYVLKRTHTCTGPNLRAAEAVAFASGVPERAGLIMAYRHMREHGRLDVARAFDELEWPG